MIDFIAVFLICILINSVELISVIYFAIGIGLLGAIDILSRKKISIKKPILLTLQTTSTVLISLSLLDEAPAYLVFFILIGMCIFYSLYNLKNAHKISTTILLVIASLVIDFAFYHVLDIFKFILFTIGLLVYFCLVYYKKPISA